MNNNDYKDNNENLNSENTVDNKAARTVVIEEAMSSILAVIQLTITAVTM